MTKPAFSDDQPLEDGAGYHSSGSGPTRLFAILIIGVFTILLVIALKPENNFREGAVHPGVGQPMEKFKLTPLVGTEETLSLEQLRGEVVLINFWGTWCGPCMIEFPHLVALNERLHDATDFRFVPVSCGASGPDLDTEALREPTKEYLERIDADLAVYSDQGATARLGLIKAAQLSSFGFPTTLLLDREGVIQGLWQGYRPDVEIEIEAAILDLL